MPNSFALAPGVVPGSQKILGNFFTLGPNSPRVMIVSVSPIAVFGDNIADPAGPRQDPTQPGRALLVDNSAQGDRFVNTNTAGATWIEAIPRVFKSDNTTLANTGNTTENTMRAMTLKGGQLGAFGGLRWIIAGRTTAQGGVASTLRAYFGGTLIISAAITTAVPWQIEILLKNNGLTGAQHANALLLVVGSSVFGGAVNIAVNSAVDQTLQFTIQNGSNTDNHEVRFNFAEIFSNYDNHT